MEVTITEFRLGSVVPLPEPPLQVINCTLYTTEQITPRHIVPVFHEAFPDYEPWVVLKKETVWIEI